MNHISVCICTFRRQELLRRLLEELEHQYTGGSFTYSIVVVDNDRDGSAQPVVASRRADSYLDIRYCLEPEQNIALARNRAVAAGRGDLVAFIDDDELPARTWLHALHRAWRTYGSDGVLGPVLPSYEKTPPAWIVKGGFYERPSHPTGTVLPWTRTRSGNVLLDRNLFVDGEARFRKEFGSGGEDRDFFRRMIARGKRFIWCAEAPVYETVPPERYSRSFLLRRALLRGKIAYNHSIAAYGKSIIALPLYAVLLPFLLIAGQHVFMRYLVKSFDHLGRLLYLIRVDVVKQKYVLK